MSSEGLIISGLRELRFSSDPNGANSITSVYRYIRKAWKLWQRKQNVEQIVGLHSRYKRHIWYLQNLPLFGVLLLVFATITIIRNCERTVLVGVGLACVVERGEHLIFIVLKVTV